MRKVIILLVLVLSLCFIGCDKKPSEGSNGAGSVNPPAGGGDNGSTDDGTGGGNGSSGDGWLDTDNLSGELPDIFEKDLTEALKKMEEAGTYPKLDRSDNILGTDSNNNGVRDDIEKFIDSRADTTPDQKQALKQEAKAFQNILAIDLDNKTQLFDAANKVGKGVDCTFYRYRGVSHEKRQNANSEIATFMFNTRDRYKAYEKFNKKLNWTVWDIDPNIENSCERID